ncbi:MAG: nucleotidyltransferase, partial [Methanosarcinaceae archaeon]|nr:nucleotidyltransferase [Methanosarcinaceae archaeon]
QKRLELASKLVGILENSNVDLLVLNDTAPVLSFEIIGPNVLIFERDHGLKIDVEQRIMSAYLDRKYHEDLMDQMFLERVREKGLT